MTDDDRAEALFKWFMKWIDWMVGKETPHERIMADYAAVRAEATLAMREACETAMQSLIDDPGCSLSERYGLGRRAIAAIRAMPAPHDGVDVKDQ